MAAQLLSALLIAIALLGGGYWWGHTATDNAWQAKQAKEDQAVSKAIDKETKRADQAAANYLREHIDQEDRYAELDSKYQTLRKRAPLVVAARAPRTPECGPAQAPGRVELPAAADAGDVPRLTLAAVRMWNGALTGVDSPAGACGAAGAAEGADAACAESAGLSLADAWFNQAVNAKSCAEDRQRYQHLIDFLNGK
ncbi:hypothetical protein [Hydrogenophaga taeniospiralis]|uniref:hypothetical protein n=1 Tax=Hydrogenophaga taeniospiralis TaxID=65656 RepID=UPI001CFBB372|nr:hypothetical protein [Hydrogenophaga taeniospiralis]